MKYEHKNIIDCKLSYGVSCSRNCDIKSPPSCGYFSIKCAPDCPLCARLSLLKEIREKLEEKSQEIQEIGSDEFAPGICAVTWSDIVSILSEEEV